MPFLHDAMANSLRAHGYRVFAPPPLPTVGTTWSPTRGGPGTRTVTYAANGHVTYADSDGLHGRCTAVSWRRWVTKRRAVRVSGTDGR